MWDSQMFCGVLVGGHTLAIVRFLVNSEEYRLLCYISIVWLYALCYTIFLILENFYRSLYNADTFLLYWI